MNVDGAEFKAALRRRALDLGAVAFGVAEPSPVPDHARYQEWLARGGHADMAYLARDAALRADPRALLPSARAVICVALPYAAPTLAPPPAEAGRVAALFVGADYHGVLHDLLDRLVETGRGLAGAGSAWLTAVDTRPLLERSLAVAAGLGRIGRHTQLIVPGHGSLVCLGVLLTDVALPPDPPALGDPCERCDACLRACPTGAIGPHAGLHAARCLSYLTTASRAAIPAPLRPRLGHRLYGCDECLVACPWNAPARLAEHAVTQALRGVPDRPRELLEAWLDGSSRGLRRALQGTALGWLPPAALRRTLCIVLGNLGASASRAALARLRDATSDPELREHAAWALARCGP